MKAQLIYSVAALGAIPVTANATVNAYVDGQDSHLVSTDAITLQVGNLVKGNYVLKSNAVTGDAENIKLNFCIVKGGVDGDWQEVDLDKKIDFAFALDADASIIIKLKSSGGIITVGGINIEAVFDFVTLANGLQKEYNAAINEWNAYTFAGVTEYTSKDYQSQITLIKGASGVAGYEVFKKYELGSYTTLADFSLYKSIKKDRQNAKKQEVDFLGGDGSDFAKANTAYGELSDFLTGAKKDVTKKYNDAVEAYNKLNSDEAYDGTGEVAKAAQNAIKDFITALTAAQEVDKANTDAYNDLIKKYDALYQYEFTDVYQNLQTKLTDAGYNELWNTADGEYTDATTGPNALTADVKKKIENAKTDGKAVEEKAALSKEMDEIKQLATALNTKYTLAFEDLEAANAKYKAKKAEVDKEITAEVRTYTDLSTYINDVDVALADMKKLIDNNDATVEAIENIITEEALKAKSTAVDNAFKAFNAKLAIYQDYLGMKKAVADEFDGDNESNWTKALTEVADYAKNDANKLKPSTYVVADLWAAVKAYLQTKKTEIDGLIETNKATADKYKTNKEYTDALTAIKEVISKFKANAKAAIDLYAPAQQDVATATKLYNEVVAAIVGLDITDGTVKDNPRTPYNTKLAELKAKIDEIDGFLKTSLTKTASKDPVANKKPNENNHLGYLNAKKVSGTSLDEAIATLTSMKENYQADQKAWEAQRDAQIAANIHQNIVDLAATFTKQIEDAQKNDDKAIDFGPMAQELADAIKPVADLIAAKVATTGGIEAQTKAYNELDAIDDAPNGVLYKLLNTTIRAIKAKLANYDDVMANYNAIDFKAAKKAVKDNDGTDTYFTGLLDGAYMTEYTDLKNEILGADWSKPATKDDMNTKVTTLKDKVTGTADLALANRNAYTDAKARYDTEDDKSTAIPAYEDAKETMKDYPSSELKNQLRALEDYKASFAKLIADAKTSYEAGKAFDDNYAKKLVDKIAEMNGDVKKWTDEVNYNVQIAKDNKAKYENKTLAAKKAAEDAYVKAASDINAYNNFQSAAINKAAADAAAEKQALLDILDGFNEKLAEIAKAAEDAYVGTVSPAIYDPSNIYSTQFKNAEKEINDAKTAFINKVKASLDNVIPANVAAYDAAIKASKEKAKAFGDIKTWYAGIDGMLAKINTEYGAAELDLKALDKVLVKAEDPGTGIFGAIVTLEGEKAQAALKDITLTSDEVNCLETADKKRWNELVTLRNDDTKRADMVQNFAAYKSEMIALQKKAKENKQNNDNIVDGKTALTDALTAVNGVYTLIDNYAAGSKVKAIVDGYQSQIKNFGTVTLDNFEAAVNLKKDIAGYKDKDNKFVRGKIDNELKPALFDAELTILNSLVSKAEEEYITYAATAADAAAVKADIAAYKKTIGEIAKIAAGEKVGSIEKKDKVYIIDLDDDATYSMVNVEGLLTNIIKDMQTANETNTNATVAAGLTKQVNDQLDRLDNWDDIETGSFLSDLNDRATTITGDGTAIKTYITTNTNKISTYADNVNAKIADLTAAIDQFLLDVQDAHNKTVEQIMSYFNGAENFMSATNGAARDLQWATGELTIYGATSKYANKLNQIQGLIDDMNATIAANKAKAETITKFADLQTLAYNTWDDAKTLNTSIQSDLNEIVGFAKKAFVDAAYQALLDQLKAVVINADEYTTSDKATLDGMKADIQTDIDKLKASAKLASHWDAKQNKWIDHNAAVTKAILDEGAEKFDKDLKALKDKMKELNYTQDVKGHITGGEVIGTDDIQALANIIISGQEGEQDPAVCDINGDGRVTVTDIIWLQYFWAFNEWPNPAAAARGDFNMNDAVNMEVVSTNGRITRLAINLNNSDSYRAFQIGMQLPAGAKVVGQSLGDRVQNANLMHSESAMGNVRFLTMTSLNSSFEGNEGAVLYVDIENLNGDVTLTEAYFTNSEMNEAAFVNNGQTTSIRESITNALESAGQKIYNMGGRVMNGLKKGINIIRRNDGSNEKVIVK